MTTSDYLQSLNRKLQEEKAEDSGDANTLLEIANDEGKIDELINTLNDSSISDETRREALNVLHTISIFSPVLPTKMPEYVNALRGLLDIEGYELRKEAYTSLAVMKDEEVQKRLLDELTSGKGEAERALPSHHAIALLGMDEKALNDKLLRKIVRSAPTEECLSEAIRHMSSDDVESTKTLLKIMEDNSIPLATRRLIPSKVSTVNPAAFLKSAKKIISQDGLSDDLAPYLIDEISVIDIDENSVDLTETKDILKK